MDQGSGAPSVALKDRGTRILQRLRPRRAEAGRGGGYRALFAIRDFRLLISAYTVSSIGNWAYSVALIVFIFNATHSAAWVAAATAARFIPQIIGSPFGGLLADRVERVRLMVHLDVTSLALQLLLVVIAAATGPPGLALVAAVIQALIFCTYNPAQRSVAPEVVGEEHLAAANGLQASIEQLAIIAGPALGGVLLFAFSPAVVFGINAATFAYSAFMVSRVRTRSRPGDITRSGTAGPWQQLAAGVKAFIDTPAVALLAGFSILATFIYGTDNVLYPVIGKQLLGMGANGFGYLLATSGAGAFVVALFMNRVSMRRLAPAIVLGMALYCLPTALMPVVHSPPIAGVIQAVRGGGTIIVDVLAVVAMQRLVPRDVLARVFGVFFAFVPAAATLGAAVTPPLLSAFGLTPTLLLAAFVVPLVTALAYPKLRAMDHKSQAEVALIAPRVAVLQGLEIFTGATRFALEQLASAAREEDAEAGTVLIHEGDAADDFFVLTSGAVEVTARGEGGEPRVLNEMEAPTYFGEIGLLEKRPRTATVTATQPCTLYRIAGDVFVETLTVTGLPPAALARAQSQLALTNPSASIAFAEQHPG